MSTKSTNSENFEKLRSDYRKSIERLNDELMLRIMPIMQSEIVFKNDEAFKIHAVISTLRTLYHYDVEPKHSKSMRKMADFFNMMCSVSQQSQSMTGSYESELKDVGVAYSYTPGDDDFFASQVFLMSFSQIVQESNILPKEKIGYAVYSVRSKQCVPYYDIVFYGLTKVKEIMDAGQWEELFHSYIKPLEVVFVYSIITKSIMEAVEMDVHRKSRFIEIKRQRAEFETVMPLVEGNAVIQNDLSEFSQNGHHSNLSAMEAFRDSSAEIVSRILSNDESLVKKDLGSASQIVNVAYYVVMATAWSVFCKGMKKPRILEHNNSSDTMPSWIFEIVDSQHEANFNGQESRNDFMSQTMYNSTLLLLTGVFDTMSYSSYEGVASRRDLTANDAGIISSPLSKRTKASKSRLAASYYYTKNFRGSLYLKDAHREYTSKPEANNTYDILRPRMKNAEMIFRRNHFLSHETPYTSGMERYTFDPKGNRVESVDELVDSIHLDLDDSEVAISAFFTAQQNWVLWTFFKALCEKKNHSKVEENYYQNYATQKLYNTIVKMFSRETNMMVPIQDIPQKVSRIDFSESVYKLLNGHITQHFDEVFDVVVKLLGGAGNDVVDAVLNPSNKEDVIEFAGLIAKNIDTEVLNDIDYDSDMWNERCRLMFFLSQGRVSDFLYSVFSFYFRQWTPAPWYFLYSILMLSHNDTDSYVSSWYSTSRQVQSSIMGIETFVL